ncbi:MAG: hypothetical protein NTZ92_00270 [Candidatus Omnitrophica bacterium]|nr:hypothetical protein [Candidatus Omnitrophota bacterium]
MKKILMRIGACFLTVAFLMTGFPPAAKAQILPTADDVYDMLAIEKPSKLSAFAAGQYVSALSSSDVIDFVTKFQPEKRPSLESLRDLGKAVGIIVTINGLFNSANDGNEAGVIVNLVKLMYQSSSAMGLVKLTVFQAFGVGAVLFAAQRTLESYQEVEKTGRERDIEVLYGTLQYDKFLRPALGKEITIDHTSVEYVYQTYVVGSNTRLRDLVSVYVKDKLERDFPKEGALGDRGTEGIGESSDVGKALKQHYRDTFVQACEANKEEILTYLAAVLKEINLSIRVREEFHKGILAAREAQKNVEKLQELARSYEYFVLNWSTIENTNRDLLEKYGRLVSDFPGLLEKARKEGTGTAAREVRDQLWLAIENIKAKGYFGGTFNELLDLKGQAVFEMLEKFLVFLKEANSYTKGVEKVEKEKEVAAYEKYVAESKQAIDNFVSFTLDKYPLESKFAQWAGQIDRYFEEGGTNGTQIWNELKFEDTAEECKVFYQRQMGIQRQAYLKKLEEIDKLSAKNSVYWDKSQEWESFRQRLASLWGKSDRESILASRAVEEQMETAKQQYLLRQQEKAKEIEDIHTKLKSAWFLFGKELEHSTGLEVRDITGTGLGEEELGGAGLYKFADELKQRILGWELKLKAVATELEIINAGVPQLSLADAEDEIKKNNQIMKISANWDAPELVFNKIPKINGTDLSQALKNLQEVLQSTPSASSGSMEEFVNSVITETDSEGKEVSYGNGYSLLKNKVDNIEMRISELEDYLVIKKKIVPEIGRVYLKWGMVFTGSNQQDPDLKLAEKLIVNLKAFKQVMPPALDKLSKEYQQLQIGAADRRAFLQGRMATLKHIMEMPFYANFNEIKNSTKLAAPLKASFLYSQGKGYLDKEEISKLQEDIKSALTDERMQFLKINAPEAYKYAEEIKSFAAKIKPVSKNEFVGADGVTVMNSSEQEKLLDQAQTPSQLAEQGWEKAFENNDLTLEMTTNIFVNNYLRRLAEAKKKQAEIDEMNQKVAKGVTIKSIKVDGKPVAGGGEAEVKWQTGKQVVISGEIESGLPIKEASISSNGNFLGNPQLASAGPRGDALITNYSYSFSLKPDLTSAKISIYATAGPASGVGEFTLKVTGDAKASIIKQLEEFLDEARKIPATGDYQSRFGEIAKKMEQFVKSSGISSGDPDVVKAMNTLSEIMSAARNEAMPGGPSGPVPGTEPGAHEDRSRGMNEAKALYDVFAASYSTKNLSGLKEFISDNWSSASGSSVGDMEDALTKSFRSFDRIEYKISGLSIRPLADGTFEAKYKAQITGQISKGNIKQEETSTVTEILGYENQQLKILKTSAN